MVAVIINELFEITMVVKKPNILKMFVINTQKMAHQISLWI